MALARRRISCRQASRISGDGGGNRFSQACGEKKCDQRGAEKNTENQTAVKTQAVIEFAKIVDQRQGADAPAVKQNRFGD